MSTAPTLSGRRGPCLGAATTAVLLAAGLALLYAGRPSAGPPQPASVPISATGSPTGRPPLLDPGTGASTTTPAGERDVGRLLAASEPVTLQIPSIGVHATTIVDLGYTDDGALQVPADYDLPGWFTLGPTPGELGPAVIAGHVDSLTGPAVFFRLGALKPGATATIGREDGTIATFTVDRVERYPKERFPTTKVYANTTNRAELRLITCGGTLDRHIGHYTDNVVAYAHLTA